MYLKQLNTPGTIAGAPGFQMGGDNACCPDNSNAVCKFGFVITDLTAITSITIDGNVHTITATDETDPGDIAMAINQAFIDEGYFNSGEPSVFVYKNIWADTETVILIYANADTVTMVTVPVADTNGEKACVPLVLCRYSFEIEVGLTDFNIADSLVEIADAGNSPQNVADTYATGAAGSNALGSDVYDAVLALYDGEDNAILSRVKVTENLVTGMRLVQVWLFGHRPLSVILDGETEELVTKHECKLDYTILQA